jgi:pectate lyase
MGAACALGIAGCLTPEGYTRAPPDGGTGQAGTSGGAGTTGGTGKAGTSGTGTAGATGITGVGGGAATGNAGTTGAAGTAGLAGRGGTTGAAGTSGVAGTSGAAGTTGAAGTSGAGTVLFSDDFESGSANWITDGPGTAAITTDGSHVYELTCLMSKVTLAAAGNVTWTNQVISARIKILAFNGSSSSYYAGLCGRLADVDDYYCVTLRSDGKLSIRADIAGSSGTLGSSVSVSPAITTGTFYTVELEIVGSTINAYLNGVLVDTVTDASIAAGGVGLVVDNADAEFDDVTVSSP